MNVSVGDKIRFSWGRLVYGLIFVVLLPAYLVMWAVNLSHLTLPDVPQVPALGQILIIAGAAILLSGMWAIVKLGKGLPMNAYPPERYVRGGIYFWLSHPIYLGFCIGCVGMSILVNSSSGLWVITPIVTLSSAALIWGYERPDLINRFGGAYFDHWLRLPVASSEPPDFRDIASVIVMVFLPWLLLYEGIASYIGVIDPVWVSTLPFEENLAAYDLAGLPYVLTYPFVLFAPFFARTNRDLREFAIAGLIATALVIPFYLTIPVVAEFRPIQPTTIWGELIVLQHSIDNPATAFPAFHVTWTFLAARLFAARYPRATTLIWIAAWIMALSAWLSGMHAILDIFGAAFVYVVVSSYGRGWRLIRDYAEKLANSWREWRFGPIRIINHAFYAGFAGFAGYLYFAAILGPANLGPSLFICIFSLVTAGIWAQAVEGSDRLLRPFGYYGSVAGAIIGALIVEYWTGLSSFISLGAMCVAAPLNQALGRLRCLVQGCCHGSPAPEHLGIRVTEPNSRICHLAEMRGISIYPTPLYSIIGNVFIGLVVFRMARVGAPGSSIIGIYFILSSIARFVEETYRGEPQTPVFGGLKLYQWISILLLVVGSSLTMIPSAPVSLEGAGINHMTWIFAVIFGLVSGAAMGVDFPDSDKRFTRLT
jgi:protein-S-isoprenylcysteine O-methyltransferase Ste14